jgi:ubiquinone/menaquinone biosynthesis C-methylase UbiE
MDQSHVIDTSNREAFEGRFALKTYSEVSGLMPAEHAILRTLKSRIAGKKLLDIGVGGSRTTLFLLERSRDYTAIDYSEGLVQKVKLKFGLDSVYCCDVRDMSRFPDQSFDFILFSFNGLDCIAHRGRLRGDSPGA